MDKNLQSRKPLRIAIDASRAFVANPAGPEYYSLRLIQSIAKIDNLHHYTLYLQPGQKPNFKLPQNFEYKNIGFPHLWTQLWLALEIIKNPPNLLFIPAHTVPIISRIILPQVPILVTIHGLEGKYLPHTGNILSHIYRNWSITWSIKLSHRLIAVSQNTLSDVINTYKISAKSIILIHEGVDVNLFRHVKADEVKKLMKKYRLSKYLLFVGTIQPRKNLVRLIGAFSRMATKNLQLVIAGKLGWLYDDVIKAPKRLKIEEKVIFLGRVPEGDLLGLYKGAEAFVLPSLTEGFGLPILEAQAAGVPVVCSKTGAMPEVAGKGAIFVDPLSVTSIKKGLEKILENKIKTELVKKGDENVSKYSWDKTAYNTIAYIKEIVEQKPNIR